MLRFSIPLLVIIIVLFVPEYLYAAEFNVEAETRAYLDQLKGVEREQSDAYYEGGYWLILWGTIVAVLSDMILLNFRWSAKFRDWTKRITKRTWLQPALYGVPYILVGALLTIPWQIYTGYFREKSYDFMNQSFIAWFSEQLISLAIAVVFISLFLIILFAIIRRFPKKWWLIGAVATAAMGLFTAMIAPVYISPIFNDYTEMEDSELRDDILEMAKAYDVPTDKVYVFNQSKQHKRISANVSGFAGTMRISLNDNLLNRSTPEEIKAVMGHEIGHYVDQHVLRSVIISSIIIAFSFFIVAKLIPVILGKYGEKWDVKSISDPAVLPLLFMLLTLISFLTTPIDNSLTRITESQADAFGLDAAREPDGFASIAMKLSEYRKAEPGKIEEIIFHHHPSGATRVRMAMEWKAKHMKEEK